MSFARRRLLRELAQRSEETPEGAAELAVWLLAWVPVCSYLEMAEWVAQFDAEGCACLLELRRWRERLFFANYGLAKIVAQRPQGDPADQLSAASTGLRRSATIRPRC